MSGHFINITESWRWKDLATTLLIAFILFIGALDKMFREVVLAPGPQLVKSLARPAPGFHGGPVLFPFLDTVL
jgi:hypothetical protein